MQISSELLGQPIVGIKTYVVVSGYKKGCGLFFIYIYVIFN